MTATVLQCGRFNLSLKRPLIMGVVNITPDSFSDGNQHFSHDRAIAHAQQLIDEGADILDIGGESSRPGADAVSVAEELRRIMPVIDALLEAGIPLSVDTFKPQVMREVLAAGVDMINDISGFRQDEAIAAVADHTCGVCVMHMQGLPKTMQNAPHYDDLTGEIRTFLEAGANRLTHAGVARERIVIDPGFGFGKTTSHNYELLRRIREVMTLELPWLIGVSRKSMIGAITGRPVSERLAGSLAAMLVGVQNGASIVRVHDVAQTVDALKVWRAIQTGGSA